MGNVFMGACPGMPRGRYDDEALRARALELRSKGLSYREIARELGCSVFKVYQIISPYESPRSRIKQVLELATRVEELDRKLRELESLASRLESTVKPPVFNIEADLELLCRVAAYRVNMGVCAYMDGEGYCNRWCFYNVRVSGLNARRYSEELEDEGNGKGEVWECYEPNVLTHWALCLVCPAYTPADDDGSRKILEDRIVECVNGKLVFRKIERATPNAT
jgi:predicted transcriptional regulator